MGELALRGIYIQILDWIGLNIYMTKYHKYGVCVWGCGLRSIIGKGQKLNKNWGKMMHTTLGWKDGKTLLNQ